MEVQVGLGDLIRVRHVVIDRCSRETVRAGAIFLGPADGGVNGHMDTCIAIRTLLVESEAIHVQAGAGIVHDSVPRREHEECLQKAQAGLRAIQLALASSQLLHTLTSGPTK